MSKLNPVITGVGVVSPLGIGKEEFWKSQLEGKDSISRISLFSTDRFSVHVGGEVKNFDPKLYLGQRGLRNLDRSALFILVAAKQAIEDSGLVINEETTDEVGVVTGTTLSHFWSVVEFDREVFEEGIDYASPAFFPSTVINAVSSLVSIRFNIQGFNTTVSTGYTSSLEALKYGITALSREMAKTVLVGGVETITFSIFFGFNKLEYMAGIKGVPLSCPFDRRHNGPLMGEAAVVLSLEDEKEAKGRGVLPIGRVRGVASYFDGVKIGKVNPKGYGLEQAIRRAIDEAGVGLEDIDYVSCCANSSVEMDRIEVKILRKIFGKRIKKIPVSSIKSMLGETFSASAALQILSSLGAMREGKVPPTINYREKDPECDIDCVPNRAQKKDVRVVLITSFGPGGYNSACVLEKV